MSRKFAQGIVVLFLGLMRLSFQQEYAGYSKYKNLACIVKLQLCSQWFIPKIDRFAEVKRNCFGWQSGNNQN